MAKWAATPSRLNRATGGVSAQWLCHVNGYAPCDSRMVKSETKINCILAVNKKDGMSTKIMDNYKHTDAVPSLGKNNRMFYLFSLWIPQIRNIANKKKLLKITDRRVATEKTCEGHQLNSPEISTVRYSLETRPVSGSF